MKFQMRRPEVAELERVRDVLGHWQIDEGHLHLHPGDLGWFALRGAPATADAVRVWFEDERAVAISLLDGAQLLRFAMDPTRRQDELLAQQIAADVADPGVGVLEAGAATIEARGASALGTTLAGLGWSPDEPWTPLHRDLSDPVDVSGLLS